MLPVCLGEATKFSTSTFAADKSYEAEIHLGITTTTGDSEGSITSRLPVSVSRDQVEHVIRKFTGTIAQIPPIYSALKRAGKPLYAYARAGQTVELQPRNVTIHSLILRDFAIDRVRVCVHCSKGTYIRVLAEDIGRELGCGATLSALRRTTVGKLDLERAIDLDRLAAVDEAQRMKYVLPVDTLVSELAELQLDEVLTKRILMGQSCQLGAGAVAQTCGLVRLYGVHRQFLGLGNIVPGQILAPKRLVSTQELPRNHPQPPKIA